MIATLPQFRLLCPTQAGISDASVELALSAASTAAVKYCGREFEEDTVTEYYDGNGYPELPLKRFPISSVSSVYLDTNGWYGQNSSGFASNTQLTAGTQYVVDYDKSALMLVSYSQTWPWSAQGSGWLYAGLMRRGASWIAWPKWPGCVKVTYTAGYSLATMPKDLISAVCSMANYVLISADGGGMITTSTSYIDVSAGSGFIHEALARGNVPALASSRAVLDSYRDWKINVGIF